MRSLEERRSELDERFVKIATWAATWAGKPGTILIVGVLVAASFVVFGTAVTTAGISVLTLLMLFVLQNMQNRSSVALHLKLDEMVAVDPQARDVIRGIEAKTEPEIQELSRDADDLVHGDSPGS